MMPAWFASDAVDSLLLVLSALEHHGFTPVAHKGLLLGALRLQGLLPWDDDADAFLLDASPEDVIRRLGPVCQSHGLRLWYRQRHGYFFVFPQTALPFAHAGLTELGLLTRSVAPDGAHFDAHEPRRHLTERELLPLQRIPFYTSWIHGPAQPEVAMHRMYGPLASPAEMGRFAAPQIAPASAEFWQRARPLHGPLDWPLISARFRDPPRGIRRQVGQLPHLLWHLANRGHWIATDLIRALAGGDHGA
jgi:hypothetical protein